MKKIILFILFCCCFLWQPFDVKAACGPRDTHCPTNDGTPDPHSQEGWGTDTSANWNGTNTQDWNTTNLPGVTVTWTKPVDLPPCHYSEDASLSAFLNGCKPETLVWGNNMSVDGSGGFKNKILNWVWVLWTIFGIWAVAMLVYGAIVLQFAFWEDEKINKAKNIIKWSLIGFFLLISASAVIYIVINVMFGLWE